MTFIHRHAVIRSLAVLLAVLMLLPSLFSCVREKPDPAQAGTESTEGTSPAGEEGTSGSDGAENADPDSAAADDPSDKSSDDEPQGGSEAAEPETARQYLPTEGINAITVPTDGKVYVGYTVNYKSAGKINGGETRAVDANGKKVEAVPNLGYKFVRWSDGQTDPVRTDTTANITENTAITAIFDYDILDMPIIALSTETGKEVKSKTEYIGGHFTVYGADPKYEISKDIEIRGRGNNSWGYEKKSYKMKFGEKVNLFDLGTGKDKVWVMLANVCDQSLQRNHVALELARTLDGVAFSPASMSVEVYLNGEYRGVYLLAEEIRDSKARVNIDTNGFEKETDIGYLVELTNYASGDVIYADGRSYQIHSDLSEDWNIRWQQYSYIADYMEKCIAALKSGNREEIESLMDLNSMIDAYLTEEVVKNLDVGWDSWYLYKEKGGKIYLGPVWDFDLSLGNANEGEEYIDGIFAGTRSGSGGGNPWHYLPMGIDWFREAMVERWDAIKESIIDKIPESILEEGSSKLRSYERNFVRWKIFGTTQNRETEFIRRLKTYTEHYEYLADWARQRIEWLDKEFHSEDFATKRLSNRDSSLRGDGG